MLPHAFEMFHNLSIMAELGVLFSVYSYIYVNGPRRDSAKEDKPVLWASFYIITPALSFSVFSANKNLWWLFSI